MGEVLEKRLLDSDGGPRERIFGFETEYGLSCRIKNGGISKHAAQHLGHIASPRPHQNEFKITGEREYVDVGVHPEYSTAEDMSFDSVANRLIEGHLKMARHYTTAASIYNQNPYDKDEEITTVNLIANTTDVTNSSWGSHENLLATRGLGPKDYVEALAIHNLSRIVWSGAGNVMRSDRGSDDYKFTLSEKAEHIWEVANNATTASRPLVNLKDEPLADAERFRRIHLVSGESLCNPFTNALRLASASIVLRACELGVEFDDLLPIDPIKAIRAISNDPTLETKVSLMDGRKVRGLDLQRAVAERSLKAAWESDYLTEQEKVWGERWIALCDDLANDPETCITRVDWLIKQRLIAREVEAKSSTEESKLSIAFHKSVDFHRLLPKEGAGMRLLRNGFFEMSPDMSKLEQGLPLPPTRAKLRANILKSLRETYEAGDIGVNWEMLAIPGEVTYRLPDPYATDDEAVCVNHIKDLKILERQ